MIKLHANAQAMRDIERWQDEFREKLLAEITRHLVLAPCLEWWHIAPPWSPPGTAYMVRLALKNGSHIDVRAVAEFHGGEVRYSVAVDQPTRDVPPG